MASLDDVLAPHILEWIYNESFDEGTIPDKVLEAILTSVAVLESASKCNGTCQNNGRVVTM